MPRVKTTLTNQFIYPGTVKNPGGATTYISTNTRSRTHGPASTRTYCAASSIHVNWNRTATFTYQYGTDSSKSNISTTYWMYQANSLKYDVSKSGYNFLALGSRKDEYKFDIYGYGNKFSITETMSWTVFRSSVMINTA